MNPFIKPGLKASPQQMTILETALTTDHNIMVEAVAGSGKTTTLEWLVSQLSGEVRLAAFNRHIVRELKHRLEQFPHVEVSTIHSLGYRVLMNHLKSVRGLTRLDVKGYKFSRIVRDVLRDTNFKDKQERKDTEGDLTKMCDLLRLSRIEVTHTELVQGIARHFGIPITEHFDHLPRIMRTGHTQCLRTGLIDYVDMLHMPLTLDLPCPHSDWVLIDEAQDLSRAQRDLILRCVRPETGRTIVVGDGRQAIYGFAGADNRSFQTFRKVTDAVRLDLSVCYRCPIDVLTLARYIVPQITHRDGAPLGEIEHFHPGDLLEKARPGDLVLCRTNAPLIKHCIRFIANKKPAMIKGRDIGKGLVKIARDLTDHPAYTYKGLLTLLHEWRDQRVEVLRRSEASESSIETVLDKVYCVEMCYMEYSDCKTVDELAHRIESLFSDQPHGTVFSTVHKAKGLESERVHILHPEKLPLVWRDQRPWEYVQETNLLYVALTRSLGYLSFVHGEDTGVRVEDGTRVIVWKLKMIQQELLHTPTL